MSFLQAVETHQHDIFPERAIGFAYDLDDEVVKRLKRSYSPFYRLLSPLTINEISERKRLFLRTSAQIRYDSLLS